MTSVHELDMRPVAVALAFRQSMANDPKFETLARQAVLSVLPFFEAIEAYQSAGYEQELRKHKENAYEAHCEAFLIRHFGPRLAQERNNARRHVARCLKALAQRNGRPPTKAKLAGDLRALPIDDTVDKAFEQAGCPERAAVFKAQLAAAARGDKDACDLMTGLASMISRFLPSTRGRHQGDVSATHGLLVHILADYGAPLAYTFSDDKGGYIDRATRATRAEFGLPNFDPTSSVKITRGQRRRTGKIVPKR